MCFNDLNKLISDKGILYLSYGGFLSQSLISGMTDALEHKGQARGLNMNTSNAISIIFIEITQNIMNYATSKQDDEYDYVSEGLVLVGKDEGSENFYVYSQNIIAKDDMEKIRPRLERILFLSKEEIKKEYKELRRNGRHTHGKGAGIGFYEIAKKSKSIEFEFIQISEHKYCFQFKSLIAE